MYKSNALIGILWQYFIEQMVSLWRLVILGLRGKQDLSFSPRTKRKLELCKACSIKPKMKQRRLNLTHHYKLNEACFLFRYLHPFCCVHNMSLSHGLKTNQSHTGLGHLLPSAILLGSRFSFLEANDIQVHTDNVGPIFKASTSLTITCPSAQLQCSPWSILNVHLPQKVKPNPFYHIQR